MKWKSALKAEEAALLATGLDRYKTIKNLRADLPMPWEDPSDSDDPQVFDLVAKAEMAEELYEALCEEILVADLYSQNRSSVKSILEIAIRVQLSEYDICAASDCCTVTKQSLAKWFWQHDQRIAKLFWADINDELAKPLPTLIKTAIEKDTSTKSANSYLKTIYALSDALVDGLTGKPNTDAECILAALATKGVDAPVGKKTLADYLAKAKEL